MSLFKNFGLSGQSKQDVENINGNNHLFRVELNNGSTKVRLKFAAIDELIIVDDLRYFYCYGKMTFNYNNDPLESCVTFGNSEPGSNNQLIKPYTFRGDGRDILEVEIMPQMKDSDCLEASISETDREKYCIKHIFSIYHYEDMTDGSGFKRRTLYFWDRDFQYLNNIQLDFSTDKLIRTRERETINVNSAEVNIKQSTQNNSIYTGDAIKGILTYALKEQYGIPIKFGKWDTGGSKINYTSPAQYKAVDDLDFLITYHVSDDQNGNLPAILKKQRYTEKYQLIPINKFYDEAEQTSSSIFGDLFGKTEDFFLGKLNTGESCTFNGSKIATEYTVVDNYNFTKISPRELQEYFTTYAVHTNDPRGNFRTDIQPNNYQKIKELYDKVFVKNTISGNSRTPGSPVTNVPDNLIREQHKNTRHVFVPYALEEKQRKSFGINRTMLNLFFKNTGVTFTARGNTARQAGKLISMNRRNSDIQPTHDSNITGNYLITYIRHEFKGGTYMNIIQATKPYTTKDPEFAKLA
jgi:hypothetical protein